MGLLAKRRNLSLHCAGLVALTDVKTVALRSALMGTSSYLDVFVICSGLHREQDAPDLSKGEYPACAAMTTGYVFRVENEATVLQLQRLGRTGYLTTLSVKSGDDEKDTPEALHSKRMPRSRWLSWPYISYLCAVALCISIWVRVLMLQDLWALAVLGLYAFVRLINVTVIRRRAAIAWKGAPEPGVKGDLLILLSQDRWIRMRGNVDDLKAVTSGQWLREPTLLESTFTSLATVLVYLNIFLLDNAGFEANVLIVLLLLCSAGLLGMSNECTRQCRMYDKIISIDGEPRAYLRRLDLAGDLIEQTGRDDWAIRLGMVQPKGDDDTKTMDAGPKIM